MTVLALSVRHFFMCSRVGVDKKQNGRTELYKSRLKLQVSITSFRTLVKSNAAEFSVDCKTHES